MQKGKRTLRCTDADTDARMQTQAPDGARTLNMHAVRGWENRPDAGRVQTNVQGPLRYTTRPKYFIVNNIKSSTCILKSFLEHMPPDFHCEGTYAKHVYHINAKLWGSNLKTILNVVVTPPTNAYTQYK